MISAQLRGSEWCVAAQDASHIHAVKSHLSSVLTRRTVSLSRPLLSRPVPSPHHESASPQWSAPWKRRWRCCVYLPPGGKKLLPLKSIRGTNYLTSCFPPPPNTHSPTLLYMIAQVCRSAGAQGVQRWQVSCVLFKLYITWTRFFFSPAVVLYVFLPEQFAF